MRNLLLVALLLLSLYQGFAQTTERRNKKDGGYFFTVVKENGTGPVANQSMSSTCWSFSTASFLESELMRMGKPPVNLSEMFVVHQAYISKAEYYIRLHGNHSFSPGGAFHDPLFVLRTYGAVPEAAYTGLPKGETLPNHLEMDEVLQAMLKVVVERKTIAPTWRGAVTGVLDAYLGKVPESFEYQGKTYTPRSFADMLGLNPDNYIEIGSYTHHPFYKPFVLEVPDNWMMERIQNVPLDEMMEVIDEALMNGYTVAWGADISESTFSHKNGVAVIPAADYGSLSAEEKLRFFDEPREEKNITQEIRQEGFDDYSTQDDHAMHIVGLAKDQKGTKYYIAKNSWGTENNQLGGYVYVSESYVRAKTTSIMVHKDAVPKKIQKKFE